jgi:hypothetical protein
VASKIFFKRSKIKTWVSRPSSLVFQKLSKPTHFQNLWGKFQIEVSQEDTTGGNQEPINFSKTKI